MDPDKQTTVVLTVEKKQVPSFSYLLGQGFRIPARIGCSVRELLCLQLGIEKAYLDTRVQTIFLNGKAVDDVDTAVVGKGSVLALSAAMPGLAGAVLRRGGHLAPMRSQISHPVNQKADNGKEDVVVMKLFNLLVGELGPDFLQRGIWVDGNTLKEFLNRQGDLLFQKVKSMSIDGKAVDPALLGKTEWEGRNVFFQIILSAA